jgi:NitT/TauT family transport system permease protein
VRHRGIGLRLRNAALPPLTVLAVILLWELAQLAGLLPITVPPPSAVARSLAANWNAILFHLGPTVSAALSGYGCAALVTVALAGLATIAPRSAPGIVSSSIILHSIPLIALTPMLVLWLGPGLGTRAVIAAFACFFPMLIGALQGFRSIDANAAELFHLLSATPMQRLRMLAFPSALPFLFSGLKVAAPAALLGTIVAEWAGANRGLGLLMLHALFAFQIELVWVSIIVCSALAVLGYGIVALIERRVISWDASATIAEIEDG